MDELRLIPLDARRLQDFERLLSGKEFGGCYCAVWSNQDEQWAERCKERPHENLEHTSVRVRKGQHAGFLVARVADGAIVAWTGSGPKPAFPSLKDRPGSRLGTWSDSVWAVGCLAIGFANRGRHYAPEIVRLIVAEAISRGASSVEAYPIEPASEEGAYRGTRKLYEDLGFTVADGEPSGDLHAVRMVKTLEGASTAVADEASGEELTTG
ncbi:MAG: hypothetical protein COB53_13355 [Elusimicrobia bacterium]|nr:MAG: hypothetical protein COB53_13355 [Elusimicrobiota bacterium]